VLIIRCLVKASLEVQKALMRLGGYFDDAEVWSLPRELSNSLQDVGSGDSDCKLLNQCSNQGSILRNGTAYGR
jgi:hypothetical protein